jgi:hypothetical protein
MPIESAAELYVHAIAIEREAAERYAEFARRMSQQGNEEVARLFRRLAGFESEHLAALRQRTAGVELPELSADYSWLDATAPETMPLDLLFGHMTPRQALAAEEAEHIALIDAALARAGDLLMRA